MAKNKRRYAGPPVRPYSVQDRVNSIMRNGITLADLKDNFERGKKIGYNEGLQWGYDSAWGAVMLALHREFGFGRERLARLANATADVQIECITSQEAFRKIVDETGLTLPEFREAVDAGGVG